MSIYDPWAALACTFAVLCTLATPMFRAADTPLSGGENRQSAIDGLRGLAAFGVFLHHAAIYHDLETKGLWQLPPSRFFSMVGQVGVSVFFLITGYLFWSKLLRERGRPNWVALYIGRVFRIGPVFSLAVLGITIAAFAHGNWALLEGLPRVISEVASWLCLGMNSPGEINGDPNVGLHVVGVTWSLQYEWVFYASLVVLSVGALDPQLALPFTVFLSVCCIVWWHMGGPYWHTPSDAVLSFLFAGGMVCASLNDRRLLIKAPRWLLSSFVLATVIAVFALFPFGYGMAPALLLTLAFYFVISGGDMLGLLCSRPARRLGDVSFGIYMFQGLTLMIVFQVDDVRAWAVTNAQTYWVTIFATAVLLVTAATVAHTLFERPGIRAGRQFLAFFRPLPAHRSGARPIQRA